MFIGDGIVAGDEEHLKKIRKCVIHLLSIVFKFFSNCLADEEKMIINYSIDSSHRQFHEAFHAVLMEKLQSLCMKIIKSARDSKRAIPSTYAKKLKDVYLYLVLLTHFILILFHLSSFHLG